MKLIRNILGAIWALWGLIAFSSTLLVIIIPVALTFLVKDPRGMLYFKHITKLWMQVFLTLIGCPLKVKGKEHFAKGKNYVVVCNHNSLMDIPVTTPFVPGANKTIGKKSFTKAPLFGIVYIRGTVLVDRNSNESRRRSYDEMKKTLAKGLHMVIYPEGTRNKTNDPLKSFYDGAFNLAIDTNKEVMPTLIFNTKKILPAGKPFYLSPHKIEMHFLPPVSVENMNKKELREKVFKIMWDYYKEKQANI